MKSNRREFLQDISKAGTAAAVSSLLPAHGLAAEEKTSPVPLGKADSCIFIWLGGGAAHIDTWDPKLKGDPKTKKAGSYYDPIPTAIQGVRVCQHLARTASMLDRGILLRSLTHPLKVDHADSTNLMKTGRLTSGTVVYPSLGSLVSHQRMRRSDDIPPYLVMGYPNVTRGPGFLGSRYGYLYLTDTEAGPGGMKLPSGVNPSRHQRRLELLDLLRTKASNLASGDRATEEYAAAFDEAQALLSGSFAKVFDLNQERSSTRERYGDGFGQRCLLARRLVESGVRFVEVAYDLNFKNGIGSYFIHRNDIGPMNTQKAFIAISFFHLADLTTSKNKFVFQMNR